MCLWSGHPAAQGDTERQPGTAQLVRVKSLEEALEKGHRAGGKSLVRATWSERGERLGCYRLHGFAVGSDKLRENEVTADASRPEVNCCLKTSTGPYSYWVPVKITWTLQTPLWPSNGYDALFLVVLGISLRSLKYNMQQNISNGIIQYGYSMQKMNQQQFKNIITNLTLAKQAHFLNPWRLCRMF